MASAGERKETEKLSANAAAELRATRPSVPRIALLLYHRDGVETVSISPESPMVVGRATPSDIVIEDVNLSRQHARFTVEDGEVMVEDLGSTNGTTIGGVAIEKAPLRPGDEVLLGTIVGTLHELGAEAPTPKGLLSHERFRSLLADEIARARFFERRVTVIMVHADVPPGHRDGHIRFWLPRVQRLLRPVDRIGMYSDQDIEILMPEAPLAQAEEIARAIATAHEGHVRLRCGIAECPDVATSVEEVLGLARAAAQRASPDEKVAVAADADTRTFAADAAGALEGTPIAESAGAKAMFKTAQRVAKGLIPVLLQGETGSGKEVVARFIHEHGPRAEKPLVCVNCGAIPSQLVEGTLFGHEKGAFTGANQQRKGVFEAAHGGTVFLDEVGELPEAAQAALLRVLETKRVTRVGATREQEVDVRVISATHRDLETMVAERKFREDLLYRLNAITLHVLPLRERREDIPPLVARLIEQANRANGGSVRMIDGEALNHLTAYSWPGNVRELKNVIERAVVIAQGDTITADDLPDRVRPRPWSVLPPPPASMSAPNAADSRFMRLEGDFRTRMEQLEAEVLRAALRQTRWNQTEAARELSMPLRTLVYKIKMHGIRKPEAG